MINVVPGVRLTTILTIISIKKHFSFFFQSIKTLIINGENMKKILYGFVWYVVFLIVFAFFAGLIQGLSNGMINSESIKGSISFIALLVAILGTIFGFLPGTKSK